jgi:DNA-3-methyladenine glycosylase I
VPASTPLSIKISKELAARGFKFVGPTIVYAFMQATGMVNDHLVSCFCHEACGGKPPAPRLKAK